MAIVLVNEGRTVISNFLYKQSDPDHVTNLKLGLFQNTSGLSQTSALGDLTEPATGGYARITLSGAGWTIDSTGECTRTDEVFAPTAAGYGADIYGWFLAWTGGATDRLLGYEIDPGGPHSMPDDNFTYTIQLSQATGLRFNNTPFSINEGEEMKAEFILSGAHADRGTAMELVAYTNAAGLTAATVSADLTVPTDAAYADQVVTDATWSVAADGEATYPQLTFSPTGGSWNEDVHGVALRTVGGAAQRIVDLWEDPNAPISNEYLVDLKINPQ